MKKKQSEVAALYYLFKKLLRAMKITLFLLLVFFIQVNAKTYSQQKKISLKYDNVELAKVMKAIERQTDLYFFFNDRVLNTGRKVSVKVENSTLERVLEELFYDSYSWEVVNRMIVLKPCEKSVVQEQQEKKVFKVTGVVVDVKKQPLPGVTVRLVGTSLGTATDENGKFEITLPVTEGELEFSFVGYKAERKVLRQTNPMPMEVVLTEEVTEMEEVVVTGIFIRKAESFTGAATTFKQEDLKRLGNQNILQSLKNMDPSFMVTESVDFGSDPNRMPDIQIRGASSLPNVKGEYRSNPN